MDLGSESLFSIMSLALFLGMLHALDTDHIVAVSTLASQPQRSQKSPLWYGFNWAMGHGGILLVFGIAVLVIGMAIPDRFSEAAETVVGLVMIGMGITVVAKVRIDAKTQRPVKAEIAGTQLSQPQPCTPVNHRPHGATAVGALHGMAGSAPLLALAPVAAGGSAWQSVFYLLLFNIGVFASMLLCTGALGHLLKQLTRLDNRALSFMQYGIATCSIIVGGILAMSVL